MSTMKSSPRLPYVYQPKGRCHWFVRMRWDGREVVRRAGATEAQARRRARLAYSLHVQGEPIQAILQEVFGEVGAEQLTFVELGALYLDHIKGAKAKRPSTLKADANRLRGICQTAWAKRAVLTIKAADVSRWATERARSVSPATLNRDLSMASSVFSYGVQMGYVEDNPIRSIRRASEAGNKRHLYLTPEQVQDLLEHAPAHLAPLLLCAVATGMRRGELLGLCWEDVNFAEATIRVRQENSKTSRERLVPMCAPLSASLAALKEERQVFDMKRRGGPVFVWKDMTEITGSRLRKGWLAVLAAWEEHPEGLRFHDLRHTAASLLVNAGKDLYVVGSILGHSSAVTTQRYAHLVLERKREAVRPLDTLLTAAAAG